MNTIDRDKRIIIANIEKYSFEDKIKILKELIKEFNQALLNLEN